MNVSEHVDADLKTRKDLLGLCALKSRTCHLEGLAGAAGPVRVCSVLAIGVMISSMYFRSPGFRVSSNGFSINIFAKGNCSILKSKLVGMPSFGFGSANIRVVIEFFQVFVERQRMDQMKPHGVDGVMSNAAAPVCFAWWPCPHAFFGSVFLNDETSPS